MGRLPRSFRSQTGAEELANSASHGIACLVALAAGVMLIFAAARQVTDSLPGVIIFAVTMVLTYLCSALYHGLPRGRAKAFFMRLDQGIIFVFIAGTYTPFALATQHGPVSWGLLAAIWILALGGLIQQLRGHLPRSLLSIGSYVLLGWLAILAAGPIMAKLPLAGQEWLVGGGIAYTIGALFYVFDSHLRFAHFIWHLLAIAGTACHWLAVIRYVA